MTFDNDFFIQAQGVIERCFRSYRDELISLSGNIETDLKGDKTVVTAKDREVETALSEALQQFDGAIGIEGEEFGISGSRETYWLIDPIDGTESFIRGLPTYRNMASLIDNGQPVFTVVYKPATDELYVAAAGEGAFKNGQPIKVSQRPLERSFIECMGRLVGDLQPIAEAVTPRIVSWRMTGDFLPTAEGKVDGLLAIGTKAGPWDMAPRALLIQEAGGKVANIGKASYDFTDNNFLATNPVIFDELMELINGA